jgi:alpha-beta hydrolase superfamily lysophospholipase
MQSGYDTPCTALRYRVYRLGHRECRLVVLVHGDQAHVEALRNETASVLAPLGLQLLAVKTRIAQ